MKKIYKTPDMKSVQMADELMQEASTDIIGGGGHTDGPAISRHRGSQWADEE